MARSVTAWMSLPTRYGGAAATAARLSPDRTRGSMRFDVLGTPREPGERLLPAAVPRPPRHHRNPLRMRQPGDKPGATRSPRPRAPRHSPMSLTAHWTITPRRPVASSKPAHGAVTEHVNYSGRPSSTRQRGVRPRRIASLESPVGRLQTPGTPNAGPPANAAHRKRRSLRKRQSPCHLTQKARDLPPCNGQEITTISMSSGPRSRLGTRAPALRSRHQTPGATSPR